MKEEKANKEVVVRVRITQDEYVSLKDKAQKSGKSISEIIRISCANKRLQYRVSPEELEILKSMIELKNSLVWLANSYHAKDFESLKKQNQELNRELVSLINKIKK